MHQQAWPAYDEAQTRDDVVTIVVQVNGKVRDRIAVALESAEAEITQRALAAPKVAALLNGHTVKKLVYVPGKLVNVVV